MPKDEDILALYEWATGNCFRCARTGVDTTNLVRVAPAGNGTYDVRVCKACVPDLEEMSREAAERNGESYKPGRLGRLAS